MLDHTKLYTENIELTNRLHQLINEDYKSTTNSNSRYLTYIHKTKKIRLNFVKALEKGRLIGFRGVYVSISPHYHKNDYIHNADDLTPLDCVCSLHSIMQYLNIKQSEYKGFKVVNLEFGVNVIPHHCVKMIINNAIYNKTTELIVTDVNIPFSKVTKEKGTRYKEVKIYAKGLHALDEKEEQILESESIDINTMRFEVRSKRRAKIKTLGIHTLNDLVDLDIYGVLQTELLKEWDCTLLINPTAKIDHLKGVRKKEFQPMRSIKYWRKLREKKTTAEWKRKKDFFYKYLEPKDHLFNQIKMLIIDKFFSWESVTNYPHKTTINKGNLQNAQNRSRGVKGVIHYTFNNSNIDKGHRCLITGVNISMQKEGSKFLCIGGLKWYFENDKNTYMKLRGKYLRNSKKVNDLESEFYYLAHNIRNKHFNKIHNRKKFEKRVYPPHQLQFNFDAIVRF